MNPIVAIYRNPINYVYRHLHILFIIVPIVIIYTLSIKRPYSYLDIFSIMLPIASPYRLTIVSFYRHLYKKYIWITYNITYKGSLYFGIPGVLALNFNNLEIALFDLHWSYPPSRQVIHLTRMGRILRQNKKFVKRISHVSVDESHVVASVQM